PPNNIKVQILICSDLWFPELIRGRLPDLPDLLVIPTMSIVPEQQLVGYGRSLWHSLALTRSRENAIPVVVSDWAVQHWSGSSAQNWTCGASSISDPSTRWRTRSEEDQGFLRVESGEATILQSYVSMEKVSEYRKYRRETGLLPD
ncbi:MAG TPA: hypothetical protein VJ044_16815, partial [Candidatus Hodarchaeales archaeon]|nr:hypothetical protein [Candidatus Hodarchaeales archaeon]